MPNTREIDPQIAMSRFRRSGGSGGYTDNIDNLSVEVRDQLRSIVSDHVYGTVILASFRNVHCWVIVTTTQLIWRNDLSEGQMYLTDLDHVGVELEDIRFAGGKLQNDHLEIVDIKGRINWLVLEPGKPFFGMWGVLAWVGKRNHRAQIR